MIDPTNATTVERLKAWIQSVTGSQVDIDDAVEPYLALLLAAGVVTSSSGGGEVGTISCNGVGDGRPWVMVDGDHTNDEIMAILRAARLDEGVEISEPIFYELHLLRYSEKQVTFPKPHPARRSADETVKLKEIES